MEMLLQSMPATAILILALLVGIGEVLKKYTVLANKFLPVVVSCSHTPSTLSSIV